MRVRTSGKFFIVIALCAAIAACALSVFCYPAASAAASSDMFIESTDDGSKIFWERVNGAVGYNLIVGNVRFYTKNTSCLVSEIVDRGGIFDVTVEAADADGEVIASAVIRVRRDYPLEKVGAVSFKGSAAVWEPVKFADYYLIVLNGIGLGSTREPLIDLSAFVLLDAKFVLSVTACSDSEFYITAPARTAGFAYKAPLPAPTDIALARVGDDYIVSWPPVDGAEGYEVVVASGQKQAIFDAKSNNLKTELFGEVVIRVTAYADGSAGFSAERSFVCEEAEGGAAL